MAFPISPTDGDSYKNYIWSSTRSAWIKKENTEHPGDYDLGRLILVGEDNENTSTWWNINSPTSGSIYTSPNAFSRVPSYSRGLYIRVWVRKSATNGGDWYWMGFARGDDTSLGGDAGTFAVGAELTYNSTYHHNTITVPIDSNGTCKMFFSSTGSFSSFSANIVGYYI